MGLDMYLSAKRYLWSFPEDNPDGLAAEALQKVIDEMVQPIPKGEHVRVQYIHLEAAYWRKANQIHQWFVKNVQGGEDECRPHSLPVEALQALVDVCQHILALKNAGDLEGAIKLAEEILPTQSGFFFGGTDYDEGYFGDLENTVEMLTPWLAKDGEGEYVYRRWDFEYCSSW